MTRYWTTFLRCWMVRKRERERGTLKSEKEGFAGERGIWVESDARDRGDLWLLEDEASIVEPSFVSCCSLLKTATWGAGGYGVFKHSR